MSERISQESSKLISSLSEDSRYILFKKESFTYSAFICSQITDEQLDFVRSGGHNKWTFTDKEKAIRSIRRLNKKVPIYNGVDA